MNKLFAHVRMACGLALVMAVMSGAALAGGGDYLTAVPEIDPGSMSSALALLSGGLLILTDRCRRK